MKSFLIFAGLLCALTVSSGSVPSTSGAAAINRLQRGEMKFTRPVQLMGVTLLGDYLFVHDEEASARGEACTFVYEGFSQNLKNLVATFHCRPAVRNKVAHFTVRTALNEKGHNEVQEFQFPGSIEAHMLPGHAHASHVTIAPLN